MTLHYNKLRERQLIINELIFNIALKGLISFSSIKFTFYYL
jgi:hypothetical protein